VQLVCSWSNSELSLTNISLDLRNTEVSDDAWEAVQEKWKGDGKIAPNKLLFHPNGTGQIAINLCHLLEERSTANGASPIQMQHALMFTHRLEYPVQLSDSLRMTQPKHQDTRYLAENSSVVVLTPTTQILGNVHEDHGTNAEGSSHGRFQATNRYVEYDKELFKDEPVEPTSILVIPSHSDSDSDDWDETLVLYRIAPVYDASQLSRYIAKLTARMPRDASSSTGSQKRKWTNSDAFAVKRFKGSPLVHIFGSKPPFNASPPI
jgi:hypothetical protein